MALNFSYAKKEDIPEALREHYVEKEGIWVLEGFAPKEKVDEFRTNNLKLLKKIDEQTAEMEKFKDIDPAKYSAAVEQLAELKQQLATQKLEAEGDYKQSLANQEAEYKAKLQAEKDKALAAEKKYQIEKINNEGTGLINGMAVPRKGNLPYILADINKVWTMDENGNTVALNEQGAVRKNEKGENLTLGEWLKTEYIPNSSLFEDSKGGGALGGQTQIIGDSVSIEQVSGQDISSDTLDKIASGDLQVG